MPRHMQHATRDTSHVTRDIWARKKQWSLWRCRMAELDVGGPASNTQDQCEMGSGVRGAQRGKEGGVDMLGRGGLEGLHRHGECVQFAVLLWWLQ